MECLTHTGGLVATSQESQKVSIANEGFFQYYVVRQLQPLFAFFSPGVTTEKTKEKKRLPACHVSIKTVHRLKSQKKTTNPQDRRREEKEKLNDSKREFPPKRLEDMHFTKVLGKGAMGIVLMSEHEGKRYAVKVACDKNRASRFSGSACPAENKQNDLPPASDRRTTEDDLTLKSNKIILENEANILGRLRHANIISLLRTHHDESGGVEGITCEFGNESICQHLRLLQVQRGSSGVFSLDKTIDLIWQGFSGLNYIHKNGIIHRDIKPDNLLYKNGQLKICDFGLAKLVPYNAFYKGGYIVGTYGYMAPEVEGGESYNHLADIFSFGVTLGEWMRFTIVEPESSHGKHIMQRLDKEIYSIAMEKHPAFRCSAEEGAENLKKIFAEYKYIPETELHTFL